MNASFKPVAIFNLCQGYIDNGIYTVCRQRGISIPAFFGVMQRAPANPPDDYIILRECTQANGQDLEWGFFTKNKNALAIERRRNSNQEIESVKLTGFMLSENKGYGSYKKYALLIEFSENWRELTISFFAEPDSCSRCLFVIWNHKLLDTTIPLLHTGTGFTGMLDCHRVYLE